MIHSEYLNLWIPVCERLYPRFTVNDVILKRHYLESLDRDLNVNEYATYWHNPPHADLPMKRELRELLLKLKGPHGKTLLKAYQIREGIKGHDDGRI